MMDDRSGHDPMTGPVDAPGVMRPDMDDAVTPSNSDAAHSDEVIDDASILSTGDPAVDAAVARLAELDERDVSEHAEVYDDIHTSLRAALDNAGADRGHAGHEHAGHEHAGHEDAGHEHAGHELPGHRHGGPAQPDRP